VNSANIKKRKLTGLSRHYEAVLRAHLKRSRPASLQQAAQALGRKAMTIGLETLDLARIHQQALLKLVLSKFSSDTRATMVRRAGTFFAQAITPIENTHRVAQDANLHMDRLNHALRERSAALAASNQYLKQEVALRKSAEESLRKSEEHYGQLLQQSKHMQEQLRLLSHQLLLAQEEERKKISRELHDVIAQTLTSINVQLSTLKNKAGLNSKGLERRIARTQRLVVHSVNIVHQFARELRPTVLDDLGLIPALHTFMKSFAERTGIRVRLSAFAAVKQVDGHTRTALYRVAQEALNNVARHAQATLAEVSIQRLDGAVCMTIKDNGEGFQQKRAVRGKKGKRLGLLGMRERLEMVGGTFAVTSLPGKGTTVLAKVPLINGKSNWRRRADRRYETRTRL
jgi:signal transduction histidine kinase